MLTGRSGCPAIPNNGAADPTSDSPGMPAPVPTLATLASWRFNPPDPGDVTNPEPRTVGGGGPAAIGPAGHAARGALTAPRATPWRRRSPPAGRPGAGTPSRGTPALRRANLLGAGDLAGNQRDSGGPAASIVWNRPANLLLPSKFARSSSCDAMARYLSLSETARCRSTKPSVKRPASAFPHALL